MNAVCVKCSVELRCEKNSHGVEQVHRGGSARFFSGDRWGCPKCGAQVVLGLSRGIDSYEDGYDDRVAPVREHPESYTAIREDV